MNFKQALNNIKAFAFDVDGVLNTNLIHIGHDGELLRSMNTKDGYALHRARRLGYPIAIITGASNQFIKEHYEKMGADVYISAHTKINQFNDFLSRHNLNAEDVLYMGDDIPDYQVMKVCGLATCPLDAAHEIKAIAHYVSDHNAGEGCVRDVIEQTLRTQGKWMNGDDAFQW